MVQCTSCEYEGLSQLNIFYVAAYYLCIAIAVLGVYFMKVELAHGHFFSGGYGFHRLYTNPLSLASIFLIGALTLARSRNLHFCTKCHSPYVKFVAQ